MSLVIGDNFQFLGSKPLDSRLTFSTLADMVAMADSTLYSGIIVYCVGEDKNYQWKSTNPVDQTLGKWREFETGGGGDAVVYTPGGSYTFATKPAASASTLGFVYDITDDFTTTADFKEGAGIDYPAGTDIAVVNVGTFENPVYKYNVLMGSLANYQKKMQFAVMPTANNSHVGWIVQYTGADTANYTHGHYYECTTDGTLYTWEEIPVQDSGDSALTTAVTSNLAVGAIPSGTTIAKDTTFTEFVQKLLITEIAPVMAMSMTKSGNVQYGDSYTETLTLAVSNMGTAKKIKTIAWYQGSTLIQTDTIDSTTTGSWAHVMDTATTDTTTFKAVVTYTKSDDVDATMEKTATISFYYPKFYGSVATLTPTEATVEALTSALATGKGGTYRFTTSAARMAYAYPKSLGALTSIKDGNGFSLFDSFTRTEQSYTQNSTTVAYYLYVQTDPATVSNFAVTFA